MAGTKWPGEMRIPEECGRIVTKSIFGGLRCTAKKLVGAMTLIPVADWLRRRMIRGLHKPLLSYP